MSERSVVASDPGERDPREKVSGEKVSGEKASAGGEGEDLSGWTFEQLMAELEAVTDRLAGGQLGIEAATDLYEQAEQLHALAAERLVQVQARVEQLRSEPGSGTPV